MEIITKEAKPLFTIVIPVYNVEVYLEKCLLAIQNQTCSDYEILIINDGSQDKSGDIADLFALKDSKIRVIHKKNEGVSPTRNRGLEEARGEYLFYIDSDDWLANGEVLLDLKEAVIKNNRPNIVLFNSILRLEKNGNETDSLLQFTSQTKLYLTATDYTVEENTFPNYLWTQIYKVDFIRKTGLQFYGELYEDTLFNLQLYELTTSFYTLNKPLYIHIKRPNSLTTSKVTIRHLHLLINMISTLSVKYCNDKIDRKTLAKRLSTEYESLQKIIIQLIGQGVSTQVIEGEFVKNGTLNFKTNYANGIFRGYGINLFHRNRRKWISRVKFLFKLDVIEKKISRYVSKDK